MCSGAAEKQEIQKPTPSKPRIDCIDGCRFALVLPIVVAHFARFGTSHPKLLQFLTQENVLVGGFFVISGYVSAYTSTALGSRSIEERVLAKPELFFWKKVMSYYPLHVLVSTVFAPMFIAVERWYRTPWQTSAFRGFLNYSMLQAWFPKEAEIWNQPTWFLSALTFSNLTMPVVLRGVAKLSKDGLGKLFGALMGVSLLQKFSFSETSHYHIHCTPKPACHPLIWNLTRFHPFSALLEIVMGVVAVRNVMLDSEEDRKQDRNPLVYFGAAHASLLLRLTSRFDYNDALIRGILFVPLYIKFLTALHRDCLSDSPAAITRFFGSRAMRYLGSLSFPMFMLHGPIGQIFYKKALAARLWGRPMPRSFFPLYLLIVILASHVTNQSFVQSKRVQQASAQIAQALAARTQGMLSDIV
eukprot:CAMPEP_0176052296 /NCGR_PEP_ID=MMETSP0120_2-20121206/26001_1 /TAXON_ID=160619 /ORGANISM="Kryptoperidinium foliaceum, Strain CCMP 1326" /LENGTH=413 /DNA_ID=CAMNT_0017385735 /DNA_START=48 /DNA_END=1289 /DNA_ORIENTATION=+